MARGFGASGTGSWRNAKALWVNPNNTTWRSVKAVWGVSGGQWQPIWPPTQTISFTFDKSGGSTAVYYDSGYFTWSMPATGVPGSVEIQRTKASESNWVTIHTTSTLSGGVTLNNIIPTGGVSSGQNVAWKFRVKFTPTNAPSLLEYSSELSTTAYYKTHNVSITSAPSTGEVYFLAPGNVSWSVSPFEAAGTIQIQRANPGSGSYTTLATVTAAASGTTNITTIYPVATPGTYTWRAIYTPTAVPELVETGTVTKTTAVDYKVLDTSGFYCKVDVRGDTGADFTGGWVYYGARTNSEPWLQMYGDSTALAAATGASVTFTSTRQTYLYRLAGDYRCRPWDYQTTANGGRGAYAYNVVNTGSGNYPWRLTRTGTWADVLHECFTSRASMPMAEGTPQTYGLGTNYILGMSVTVTFVDGRTPFTFTTGAGSDSNWYQVY